MGNGACTYIVRTWATFRGQDLCHVDIGAIHL
jgi:hypothetical protein